MAEITHEQILKTLRRDSTYRELTYQAAVDEGYFSDGPTSRGDYVALIKSFTAPSAPTAPAATTTPPAAGTTTPAATTTPPAAGTTTPAATTTPPAAGTTAPAATTTPTAPAATTTPKEMYTAMSPYQRQMLLADLAIPLYEKRQSSNFWIGSGIAEAVLGFGLLVCNGMTPPVSVDEAVVQYRIQKHQCDVADYERTHAGVSPTWKRTDNQIRSDNTSDNAPVKDFLKYAGILALIAAAGSLGNGIRKRF